MKSFSVLIVDDEPAARRTQRMLLAKHADMFLSIAEAANGVEAVAFINEQKPNLVFLDIQMPGFTGFEVLQRLTYQPNIIFTTAYEEYALKAFETFSVDYLLKPIRQERLDAAMEKLQQFGKLTGPGTESLKKLVREIAQKKPTAFPVKQGDRILLFRYENISHFEAADKYANLFTVDGRKYLVDQTLIELMQKLPSHFIRIQKSYVINKEKVKEVQKHFNGRYLFLMEDKAESRLLSGLTFYETIKEELGLS
jgi:two-component system, LytTR family, response regulator